MKHLVSLIIIGAFAAISFTTTLSGYKINGTVAGLPDSTWLYLRTATPDKQIDSCLVMNGKFSMSGHVSEKAVPVYLHTAKYTNYVRFWLENAEININVKAGEFKKGTITGSATEDEDKRLDRICQPVDRQADSLNAVLEKTKDTEARKGLVSQINILEGQRKQIEKDWIKEHPASLVSANLLNIYTTTWGKETTLSLYQNLSPEMKATRYGQEISDYIALNKNIKVGDKYADFEQVNAAGKMIKLSQVKGKYILLDFWASWCGPCREENPRLVKTYNDFKDKGFAVLGVSLDENKTQWLKAINDDKLSWENVSDLRGDKNKAALMYSINAIPNNFLIDANGTIIAKNLRGKELDEKLKALMP
jgi:peroxiredoxin